MSLLEIVKSVIFGKGDSFILIFFDLTNILTLQTGRDCKSTWKSKPIRLQHGNCNSTEIYQPKFCSTCKKSKCCGPGGSKTKAVEFTCADGRKTVEPFMWIKNCACHKNHRCPWKLFT